MRHISFLKRTAVARRKKAFFGTYCGGCSRLPPNNIADGHCCSLKHSKHSSRTRRRCRPSCPRSGGLIRQCLASPAAFGCRTSDWLLRSMSYPLSMFQKIFLFFSRVKILFKLGTSFFSNSELHHKKPSRGFNYKLVSLPEKKFTCHCLWYVWW